MAEAESVMEVLSQRTDDLGKIYYTVRWDNGGVLEAPLGCFQKEFAEPLKTFHQNIAGYGECQKDERHGFTAH